MTSKSETFFFVSDCGRYIARQQPNTVNFDVFTVDGSKCWLDCRYTPTGFEDTDPRIVYPEFAHQVVSYSLIDQSESGKRWIFSLDFADLDQTKKIDPFMGNCVIKKYSARFSRRLKIRAKRKTS